MAKLVLNDVINFTNEVTAVATLDLNSALTEAAIEKTLSRDGTAPNEMEAALDMNSNPVINLRAAVLNTEPVRKAEFDRAIFGTPFPVPVAGPGISIRDYGAIGDGVANDEDAINLAHTAAIAAGTYVWVPPGYNFKVRPTKFGTGLGTGLRWYALDFQSGSQYIGLEGHSTITMASGSSSDASPKDINFMVGIVPNLQNAVLRGIVWDMNGDNNKISPNRALGPGHYNPFCCGTLNITGNNVSIDGLHITECTFKNSPGTNQIVTGQSANGVAGPLSQNIFIWKNKFINNGTDVDDHSTVYAWGENVWCIENYFFQDLNTLPIVDRNWVAYEYHGSNQYVNYNIIKGFYRACWFSSNFTRVASSMHFVGNTVACYSNGPSFYRQTSYFTGIGECHIHGNDITLLATTSPVSIKAAIEINVDFNVQDIHIHNNTIRGAGSGYNSAALLIAAGVAPITLVSAVVSHVFFYDNYVERLVTGVYARTNNGDGLITDIYEDRNTYIDMGNTDPASVSYGSRYQGGTTSPIGNAYVARNKYLARDGSGNFDWGATFIGNFTNLLVEDNIFEGMNNFPTTYPFSIDFNYTTITHRYGRQLNTVFAAPTGSGTAWRHGDTAWNAYPTAVLNISHWVYDATAGNFRAYGCGRGATGARPGGLTTSDVGYLFFDTTLAKVIHWNGAGWDV